MAESHFRRAHVQQTQPRIAHFTVPRDLSEGGTFSMPTVIGAEVARALSDEIISLQRKPGSRLTEEEVCSRYGVSRSPVREALKALEADGLIIRSARRGVRVTPMSREDLDEVYVCRAALEGIAAAGAARNADEALDRELEGLLALLRAAIRKRDVAVFFQHNVRLTRTVHRHCGNKTLIRIVDGIEKQALRYRYLAHARTHQMLEVSLAGHEEVCQAIALRDPPMAQRRATLLIRRAHKVIAGALAEGYPGTDGNGKELLTPVLGSGAPSPDGRRGR